MQTMKSTLHQGVTGAGLLQRAHTQTSKYVFYILKCNYNTLYTYFECKGVDSVKHK